MAEAFPTLTDRERAGLAARDIDPDLSLAGFLAGLMPRKTAAEIDRIVEEGVRESDVDPCAICRVRAGLPVPDPRLPGLRVPACARCRDWLAYWDGWSLQYGQPGDRTWVHRDGRRVAVIELGRWDGGKQVGRRRLEDRQRRVLAKRESARRRRAA